jgi:adenine phosphoribosyltransferase
MNNQLLLDHLRCIPDWPIKGVNFRDVTTLFKSAECVEEIANEMFELYKDKGITKIVGIESRGFVMSSALAVKLDAGIVLCRKPGKLPCDTVQQSYAKEYRSFSGALDDESNRVKFIYKTDSIGK